MIYLLIPVEVTMVLVLVVVVDDEVVVPKNIQVYLI